eukprot:5690550-Prorocentrum_lima.AAC.1
MKVLLWPRVEKGADGDEVVALEERAEKQTMWGSVGLYHFPMGTNESRLGRGESGVAVQAYD